MYAILMQQMGDGQSLFLLIFLQLFGQMVIMNLISMILQEMVAWMAMILTNSRDLWRYILMLLLSIADFVLRVLLIL